jgi:hypothetical protein
VLAIAMIPISAPQARKAAKPPALPDIPGQAVLRCAGPATATTDGVLR